MAIWGIEGKTMSEEEKQEVEEATYEENDPKTGGYQFPWIWAIIAGVIVVLMIVCAIVIINL